MPTYPDCSYVSAADTDEPTGASYIYCLAAEVRELKRAAVDLANITSGSFGLGGVLLPPCNGTTITSMETALLTLESTDGNCFIQTAPYGDYSQIYVGTWGFTPGDLWLWSEAEPVPDAAYGAYEFHFPKSYTLDEIATALNAALSVYSTFTVAIAVTIDGAAAILRMGVVIRNPSNGTFEADTAYDLVGACCVPASTCVCGVTLCNYSEYWELNGHYAYVADEGGYLTWTSGFPGATLTWINPGESIGEVEIVYEVGTYPPTTMLIAGQIYTLTTEQKTPGLHSFIVDTTPYAITGITIFGSATDIKVREINVVCPS